MLQDVRYFFDRRGYLEVETPILSRFGNTDPYIESFQVKATKDHPTLFLHTSPEFFMKRLLAAGSGPIYQMCKVFREEELGRLHNPEFTLLEWYRPGYSYQQLMGELGDFIREILGTPPSVKFTYRQVFEEILNVDIFTAPPQVLQEIAIQRGMHKPPNLGDDLDAWRNLLLSHFIEPALSHEHPVFIYDYPESQAALAVVRDDEYPVAERFELYIGGVEIANGYQELDDVDELRRRFVCDQQQRTISGKPTIPKDEYLLEAVAHGIGFVSGVALGLDRLLMIKEKQSFFNEVATFSFDKV